MNNNQMNEWLTQDSRFIKIEAGQSYNCIFQGMDFDPTGGFKGKPTVKYRLQDLRDGKVRELSSGAKPFASQMMKLQNGDQITITAVREGENKKYYVTLTSQGSSNSATLGARPVQPAQLTRPTQPTELPTINLDTENINAKDLPF